MARRNVKKRIQLSEVERQLTQLDENIDEEPTVGNDRVSEVRLEGPEEVMEEQE